MTSPLAKFEANSCETRETLSYLQDTREKRSYSNPDDPESAYQKTSDKMEFSDRDFIPVNSDSNQVREIMTHRVREIISKYLPVSSLDYLLDVNHKAIAFM